MSIILGNKNRYAKYLTDSEFNLHTYEEIVDSIAETFEVSLAQNGWEEKVQVIENDLFYADGYNYVIKPKFESDEIQVIGAEVKAASVANGEMTFEYESNNPTNDITLVITAIKGKQPEEKSNCTVYTSDAYKNDSSRIEFTPAIDLNEIFDKTRNGEIIYYLGTLKSDSHIDRIVQFTSTVTFYNNMPDNNEITFSFDGDDSNYIWGHFNDGQIWETENDWPWTF